MKTKFIALLLSSCPLMLPAQEPALSPPAAAAALRDPWSQAVVTLSTKGGEPLTELIGELGKQVGELNWIVQGDVGETVLPAFKVRDASVQSLLQLLGSMSGFEVEAAAPLAPGQLGIVVIRPARPFPPGQPPTSAPPAGAAPAAPPTDVFAARGVPLPGGAETMKVVSLGAFSDSNSWDRNVRGLKSLLSKTLIRPGSDEKLPDDALHFDDNSRLLIIRLEPQRAADAAKLVEGYVQALTERQKAAGQRTAELRKRQTDIQTALDAAKGAGVGGNAPQMKQMEEQLMILRDQIVRIEAENGLL